MRRRLRALLVAFFAATALFRWAERLGDPYPARLLEGLPESTRVLARDGTILRVTATPQGERRICVGLSEVSPHLRHAIVDAEDRRFFTHSGVDWLAMGRAALANLAAGRVVSGGSTLTMQLARTLEPRRRGVLAKIAEIFRARRMERSLTKEQILEAYLNLAPLGGGLRGFAAASLRWFGKSAADLAPEEAAALVALLPAPTRRAPDRAPERLLRWRNVVLDRMLAAGHLDVREHARARAAPLGVERAAWPFLAPHACDLALATAGGPVARTGIDVELQRAVEGEVAAYALEGADGLAVVVLERGSQEVRALVGSPDYASRPLDAALARRSAGSTLKPFLYALAIHRGAAGPDALLPDVPRRFGDWRPSNFGGDFVGAIRAADALADSRNLPAVVLLETLGPSDFLLLLTELALDPGGEIGLDAALGGVAVTPLGLARAYARFADGATSIPAGISESVLDALRRESPDPARLPAGRVAWKTGTSSGRRDAWCAGVTARHVVVVWRGWLDGRASPDLVGRTAAAPLLAAVVAAVEAR